MTIRKSIAAALLAGAAAIPALACLPAAVPERNLSWTHERSDLKPDPAVRFGKLPNGMRYAIYRNATPPGQVSMRLRFDVGDLMEADDQNGLAHFLEHMAFNGTTNVKEGEILKMLERHGLSFGREINAFTAPDQTAYMLDIPAATDAKLDTAFLFFRELAGEIAFDPKAIDDERGVIVSEDRSMYPAARRASVEKLQFLTKGQLLSKRLDIGSLDVIRTAKRERFIDLYRRYYRPERAAMIVVGDVDPTKIEAEIRRRFSDWKGAGEAGADPDYGTPAARGFEAGSTVMEGAIRDVSLNWLRPYEEEPDTRAERIESVRESLAFAVLNRRLQRLMEAGAAPFTSASAGSGKLYRSLETTAISAMPAAGREADAVAILEQEVRRAIEHGVLQPELEREIVEVRSALQARVASAGTRPTPVVAGELLNAISADRVILSPEQSLALFEESVKGFTAADAHAALKAKFSGSGPLVYAISPEPLAGGDAALAAAYQKSKLAAVAPPVAYAAKEWPYGRFGTPGRVVERTEIQDLGVTRVRFDNGVTLLVKPTEFQNDQVIVTARAAGGLLARSPQMESGALQTLAQGAFIDGGVEGLTENEMKQALSGKRYGATFSPSENAFALRGETTTKDFPVQMQVLAAYLARPGWRTDAFERKKTEFLNIYSIINTVPMNVAMTRYPRLVRADDKRFGIPQPDAIKAATVAEGRALVEPSLKSAPLEVLVVGDISIEEAIAQTAATFGALPKRAESPPVAKGADKISFRPSATPHKIEHAGRPDVALGLVSWHTDDFHDDPAEARAQSVLRAVLQIRAIEQIREQLGASYSPQTFHESSEIFDEFGLLTILAEVNPTELDRLFATIDAVAEDLKSKPLSEDELARALRPVIEQVEKDKATNNFWAARLATASWDPRRLEMIRTQKAHLEQVSVADIQRLAQKYLKGDRAFRLRVVPGPNAAAAPAGPTTVIRKAN